MCSHRGRASPRPAHSGTRQPSTCGRRPAWVPALAAERPHARDRPHGLAGTGDPRRDRLARRGGTRGHEPDRLAACPAGNADVDGEYAPRTRLTRDSGNAAVQLHRAPERAGHVRDVADRARSAHRHHRRAFVDPDVAADPLARDPGTLPLQARHPHVRGTGASLFEGANGHRGSLAGRTKASRCVTRRNEGGERLPDRTSASRTGDGTLRVVIVTRDETEIERQDFIMADGKWIGGLTPEMSVADAAKAVLSARFEVIRNELPLVVERPFHDPEHVHQLRVGTRRAGAALRVFKDCLPRKYLKAVKQHLRTIRQAAGDSRDWDVFRLGLSSAKSLNTTAGKPARDFLTGYAIGERTAAQTRLAQAATTAGPLFTELSFELAQAAQEPRSEEPPPNFGTLAAFQFGELLGIFDEAVKANPTEPYDLHQLRIIGKRARYALEIFATCFPPAFKDAVYPSIEKAQEVLGEIQDAAVGRDHLTALRDKVKLAVPDEWPRFQKGFEGLISSMRAKIPAGRKAFQTWRKEWEKLISNVKLEIVAATVTT
ncbi:MAG: hypothetical protein C0467_00270 [Planctomycetaceae bacterium]|nr:hypothetical protein [Planctomycetaceae bacterium]